MLSSIYAGFITGSRRRWSHSNPMGLILLKFTSFNVIETLKVPAFEHLCGHQYLKKSNFKLKLLAIMMFFSISSAFRVYLVTHVSNDFMKPVL
jgi:hypothetical protein